MEGLKEANMFAQTKSGMTVRVHQRIKELNPKGEEKERVQIFEGMIINQRGGNTPGATVTVRKQSHGVGVEKIFPVDLPSIVKVEPIKQAKTSRAKLFYMRTYKKKVKETVLAKK